MFPDKIFFVGYMGSGKILNRAIRKNGIENFRKTIVKICDSEEAALLLESQIITEEFLRRDDVYNLVEIGRAHV